MDCANKPKELHRLRLRKRGQAVPPLLCLAPMEGITNAHFRSLLVNCGGVDLVATEFVRITGEKQRIASIHRHTVPTQIQFMASDEGILVGCIKNLKSQVELFENDWIDLNVGCPSRRVTSRGAGAALLKEPKRLLGITEQLRATHSGPLSIKTRTGFASASEYNELLSVLADAPLDFITIHARTCRAEYEGSPQYELLSKAVVKLPYPVIGNGDITTPARALALLDSTGVHGVMCGRGAVTNPFLFRDTKDLFEQKPSPARAKRRAALVRFAEALIRAYTNELGAIRALGPIKEYCFWLAGNPLAKEGLFDRVKTAQDPELIVAEIRASIVSDDSERSFEALEIS